MQMQPNIILNSEEVAGSTRLYNSSEYFESITVNYVRLTYWAKENTAEMFNITVTVLAPDLEAV